MASALDLDLYIAYLASVKPSRKQAMPGPNTPAVNPLPPMVILLFLGIVLLEAYIAGAEANLWGSFDARISLIRKFSFLPNEFQSSASTAVWVPELFWRMLTYPFVHGSFMQSIFASVFFLALGKFVGEVLGGFAVLAIFIIASVSAALAYAFFTSSNFPLFGGFPPAYGLIGAFTFVLFSRAQGILTQQLMAFRLLGILMVINIAFAMMQSGPPLWVAELFGAISGFISAMIIHPGGVKIIINKIRRT